MKNTNTYIILTAFIALFIFSSVSYTSCKSDDKSFGCDTMKCLNRGVCNYGTCTCPSGYDGKDCSIVLADNFIDSSWHVEERVANSTYTPVIGRTQEYNILTSLASTATTFYVDSLMGDKYKSKIVCNITSPTTFEILPFEPINNVGGFRVLGGFGVLDTAGNPRIEGSYYRFISDSAGTRNDTVDYTWLKN